MQRYDQDSETSPTEAKPRPRRHRRKRAPQNSHDYLPNQNTRTFDDTDATISNPIAFTNQTSMSQSKTSIEYLSRDSTAVPPDKKTDRRSQHANRRLTKMSNTSEEVENINERRRPRRKAKPTQRLPRSVSEEVLAAEGRGDPNIKQSPTSEEGRYQQQQKGTDKEYARTIDHDEPDANSDDRRRRARKTRPREHPKKKKPRTTTYSSDNEENYQGDEEYSEIFPVDKEDVVQPSEPAAKVSATKVTSATNAVPPTSLPSNVVYIEKKGGQGFICEHKSKLSKPAERSLQLREEDRGHNTSRLDFIFRIHLGFHRFSMIAQGLLAGLALSQCIFVFSLANESVLTLLQHYQGLALPYQSVYYFLLAICVVSIFDKYIDISSGWSQFFSVLISRPSRAIAFISYLFALIFSISLAQLDDRISMHKSMPELWKKDSVKRIATWKIINLLRVIGSVLGWIMVSLTPDDDKTAFAIKEKIEKEKCEQVYKISNTGQIQSKIKPI